MDTFITLLPQVFKSLSDSSSAYLKRTTPQSFFRLDNPVIYSLLLLIFVVAVILIFYKYVIVPMRSHFIEEKRDLRNKHTQLMAAFAELDPDPVFRFDETGEIIMTNKAGIELSKNGYVVGKKLHEILPDTKDINIEECIKKACKVDIITHYDGRDFKFTLTGLPELNIGQIYGSDITDLKEAEAKIKVALRKAEESEKIKSYFLAQMSHEIRSPLTAILGFNSMIKQETTDKIPDELEYAFLAIENSGKRLTRTIDDLLNMAQLQTGKYDSHFEKVNLKEIVKNVVSEYISGANQKNLILSSEYNTEEAFVYGDGYSIRQIVLNLIDNAVKYTEKGEVKVLLDMDINKKLIISVSDTGIGMSKEFVENLFKPFTQEVMGYNRPFEGNGLGLALCKKFAELNNADISVTSVKNEGSKFTLTFNE